MIALCFILYLHLAKGMNFEEPGGVNKIACQMHDLLVS